MTALNEKAAIRYAMEERSRIMQEAQQKRELEMKDVESCKQLLMCEVEMDREIKKACDDDEIVAKKLYDELQDEILAEQLQRNEDEKKMKIERELRDLEQADAKVAYEHFREFEREWKDNSSKQILDDSEFARMHQDRLQRDEESLKMETAKNDYLLSRRLAVKSSREEFQRRKRIAWITSSDYKPYFSTQEVTVLWKDASADIENVAGGIAITIILPHLQFVTVKTKSCKTVKVEAFRADFENSMKLFSSSTKEFIAEFVIEGKDVSINDADLSYEYSSETGMLHVFIENVCLLAEDPSLRESSLKSMLSRVKNSFTRIFN